MCENSVYKVRAILLIRKRYFLLSQRKQQRRIICSDGKGPDTVVKLGMNDREVDIKVDPDGNTFVNGKKMDEEALENGTKVFIFRNSEANMTEAGTAENQPSTE